MCSSFCLFLDIIQHILDLVSSQTLDVDTLTGANNSAGEIGGGANNLGSEASLFDAAFLENMDEEAVSVLCILCIGMNGVSPEAYK